MTSQDVRDKFEEQVRLALYAAGTAEIKLGNVMFWFEGDTLSYDIPTAKWDRAELSKDLTGAVLAGIARAQRVVDTD